jgi:phospholipid-translocating ATPase
MNERMGVLVENKDTNELIFYLKGADSVMVKKLGENEKIFVNEETEVLSRQGLRTLVIGSKTMSRENVDQFEQKMMIAEQSMNNREQKENECLELLEQDLNLIGVTAVEDLLQLSVRGSIEHIREACVKGIALIQSVDVDW